MARHRTRKQPMSHINVVPYIDVMLVMLVVFMITAPMLTEGVRVDLPGAAKSEPIQPKNNKEPLVVSVDREGRYFMGRQDDVISSEDLLSKVAAVLRRDPTTQVLVRGDRAVDYGAVVHVMGLLRQAGAPTVGLITDQSEFSPPGKTKK
ncbi:Tol-Pal system protein TolR [Gammaproteobacteria bacterium]